MSIQLLILLMTSCNTNDSVEDCRLFEASAKTERCECLTEDDVDYSFHVDVMGECSNVGVYCTCEDGAPAQCEAAPDDRCCLIYYTDDMTRTPIHIGSWDMPAENETELRNLCRALDDSGARR